MPDMMLFLRVGALAAAVAAVGLLALAWHWRAPRPSRAALGWVLGVAAGLYGGAALLGWDPRWPPLDVQNRLLLILLPAGILVECLAAFRQVRWWLAWPLRLVIAAGAARVLLHGSVWLIASPDFPDERTWETGQAYGILAALALMLAVVWLSSAFLARQTRSRSVPLLLALTCAGAGVTTMLSGSLEIGQLGVPLAGALAGVALASFLVRVPPDGAYAIGVGTIGLFSLLIMGKYFSDLTEANALLLLAAPLLGWLPELPYARRLGPRLRNCLRILLVAIPVTVAVVSAQQKFDQDSQTTPTPDGEINYENIYK